MRRGLAGASITKGGEVSAERGLAGAGNIRSSQRMFYSCSCCCHAVERKFSPLHPPLGSHQGVSLAGSKSGHLEREPGNRTKEISAPVSSAECELVN